MDLVKSYVLIVLFAVSQNIWLITAWPHNQTRCFIKNNSSVHTIKIVLDSIHDLFFHDYMGSEFDPFNGQGNASKSKQMIVLPLFNRCARSSRIYFDQ
jgi:hypothetical protein